MAKTVEKGDSGSTVLGVQSKLNALGYDLAEDGRFGRNTKAAVRHFQSVVGLSTDGIVGPNSHAALDAYINDGWVVEEWDLEEWYVEGEDDEEDSFDESEEGEDDTDDTDDSGDEETDAGDDE
jgi:lysozyme family protein